MYEALLRLAQRRLPPTPGNYQAIYQEISGTELEDQFQDRLLKAIVSSLPRTSPELARLTRQLEDAVSAKSWVALGQALKEVVSRAGAPPLHWSGLIRGLLQQVEVRSSGVSVAKKREALEHVLNGSSNPDLLFKRLQALVRSWSQPGNGGDALVFETSPDPVGNEAVPAAAGRIDSELKELSVQLLQNVILTLVADSPPLVEEVKALTTDIRAAMTPDQLAQVTAKAKKFSYRASFLAEDKSEVQKALLKLLRLMIDNISELVIDDNWLHGQIEIISGLVGEQPINLRQLDTIESRLRDLIVKQSALKQNLTEAKDRLKSMLALFVDRLADFSETTSEYHGKIEKCAERITQADTIGELSDVLDEVMRETRGIQINALRSHTELSTMRQRVDESEREITRLQSELAHASEMVRHDALTGALNRKGLDEALEREVARAKRHGGSMSLAMLDIDNFKKLNDTLGHNAGDAALMHLSAVVRDTIRPQDTLARYGGEEFVILLPNTTLDDAANVMVRVQRELTRKFFLHEHEKILITFSCGVAELMPEESPEDGIKRADGAMYLAKRMGKNRVIAA